MDQSKQPKTDRLYPGQDADFGVFGPFPGGFSSWTQFSGIPPPDNEHNNFRWEQLLTPPVSPSPGAEFDVPDANYFNHFDVMQTIGDNSPPDLNADPRQGTDTDSAMLASTPVAKSLLEALNSTGSLMSQPDGAVPASDVFNFNDATQEGYKLYAEALEKLGSSGSYNLFGSSDVLPSSTTSSTPTKELDGNGSSSSKPSYSEVAKQLKQSKNSRDKDTDSDLSKKKDNTTKYVKGSKKFIARPIKGRNDSVSDDMPPTVSPDSKYGLDDFEDLGFLKIEKDEKANGLESIPPIVRKNSTSSLSSGTSGIEEIHLPKSCYSYEASPNDKMNFEKLTGSKNKGKSFDNVDDSKDQKPFFDPKKIFQSKDTNKRRGQSKSTVNEDFGPTLLNNGKPSYSGWCPTSAPKKSTHYINNNLRDSLKKTNQDPLIDHKSPPAENGRAQSNGRTEKQGRHGKTSSKTVDASSNTKPNMPLQTTFDQELIDEWLGFLYDKAKLCFHQLWTLILMVILLIFSIIVYLISGCVLILSWIWKTVWNFLERKVFKGKFFTGKRWMKNVPEVPKKIGLDENITLPSTGDEAMQRLLACKGKDPYSILGLKVTATDDDIKKYYRKQAVLVHPDKNQQPGAEEAFKILGHAFDLIGDSTKRHAYDRQLHEATEAEAAMREFNDLLTKLQEKIQQASNMMRCDNCGGKHRRIPVDRPWYAARNCDRCNIRHSAKEGDVWAETSMLGFLWHYYACMEGKVYDITEWVSCKREFFKHLQSNAHHVFYRIATEGNRGGHNNRSNAGTSAGGAGSAAGTEGDLEDFISHLFHQAMNQEGSGTSQTSWQQTSQTNNQPWGAAGATQPAANQGKKHRKKKKKH